MPVSDRHSFDEIAKPLPGSRRDIHLPDQWWKFDRHHEATVRVGLPHGYCAICSRGLLDDCPNLRFVFKRTPLVHKGIERVSLWEPVVFVLYVLNPSDKSALRVAAEKGAAPEGIHLPVKRGTDR